MSDDWIVVSEDTPLEEVLAIDVDGNFCVGVIEEKPCRRIQDRIYML